MRLPCARLGAEAPSVVTALSCTSRPQAGTTEVFSEALPGLPDGVAPASSPPGAFWCAHAVHSASMRTVLGLA
jgi:hypothetical protein